MKIAPLLVLFLATACASRADVRPEPKWMKEKGRIDVQVELAQLFLENQQAEQALPILAALRTKGVDTSQVLTLQGLALQQQGVTSEAEALFLQATERDARNAAPHKALGILYADTRQLDKAVTSLQEAIALRPNDAAVWNNLGFVYLGQGNYAQATQALQRAVKLDGSNPRYRNNLGFALSMQAQPTQALSAFESASNAAGGHANLGLALELSGDKTGAADAYRAVLAIEPGDQKAQRALKRLQPEQEADHDAP